MVRLYRFRWNRPTFRRRRGSYGPALSRSVGACCPHEAWLAVCEHGAPPCRQTYWLTSATRLRSAPMLHRFGPFELDERRFELRRSGKPIAVQRLVLETIAYFV